MEEKKIQVTLVRSALHRALDQRQTLKALRLTRVRKTVEHKDSPSVRGMIRKVSHLVKVVEG